MFFFGYPADKENLGFYIDEKNDLLIGMVPNFPEYGYFGYCKKPILTLHNVLAIREGDFHYTVDAIDMKLALMRKQITRIFRMFS